MVHNLSIPIVMEDELLISYICRFARKNAADLQLFMSKYVYDDIHEKVPEKAHGKSAFGGMVYMCNLAKAADKSALSLFLDTTMYPGISPLLTPMMQTRWINQAFRGAEVYPYLIGYMKPCIDTLKYCPICAEEDRVCRNFTWLRRAHHMPGVTVCYKHGVKLVDLDEKEYIDKRDIPDTKIEPVMADDLHFHYSVFAKKFLNMNYDCGWWEFRDLLCKHIDKDFANRFSDTEYESLFGCNTETFFNSVRKRNLWIRPDKKLMALFAIFQNVDNIHLDTEIGFDYSGYGPYTVINERSNAAEILDTQNGQIFIGTKWGVHNGWGSPVNDCVDENSKFRQIINSVTKGEYEPVDPFAGYLNRMAFVHTKCGTKFIASADTIIEGITTCPNKSCSVPSEKEIRQMVEASGKYKLISFSGVSEPMKITRLECGHTITTDLNAWKKHKGCPICANEKRRIALLKRYNEQGSYDPKEAFSKRMFVDVGNEYSLIGDYSDIQHPTEFRHNICGKSFTMIPNFFIRGGRCPFCGTPNGMEFRRYISVRSSGRYEFVSRDGVDYTVRDTITGEMIKMRKQILYRELELGQRSNLLSIDVQGDYKRIKNNIERVTDYLSRHFSEGDLFRKDDIVIPGLSEIQVTKSMEKLIKKEIAVRVSRGIYMYKGTNYGA